jgi:hypothetical protein
MLKTKKNKIYFIGEYSTNEINKSVHWSAKWKKVFSSQKEVLSFVVNFKNSKTKKKLAKKTIQIYFAKTANKTFVKIVFNFSTNPKKTMKQHFQRMLTKKSFNAIPTPMKSQNFVWNVLN